MLSTLSIQCTEWSMKSNAWTSCLLILAYCLLCGLVVRVPGYRSGGPGFDSRALQEKKVLGLERGSLSLVSTTEELLGRNSSGSGLENRECGRRDSSRWPRGTLYPQKFGINFADKRRSLGRYSSLADSGHEVFVCLFVCLYDWIILSTVNEVTTMWNKCNILCNAEAILLFCHNVCVGRDIYMTGRTFRGCALLTVDCFISGSAFAEVNMWCRILWTDSVPDEFPVNIAFRA
jgi:hypothetical protein